MTRAAEIREKLGHPVIDGDGHVIDSKLVLLDYVKQVGGADAAARFEKVEPYWKPIPTRQVFWGMPSGPHTLDRATAMMPRLLRERLDEAGIDVAIMYSTLMLPLMKVRDDEMRQVGHRALNCMLADIFRGTEDRLVPSAVIPMFTPEEALAELEHAVVELGFKAATLGTEIYAPAPEVVERAPDLAKYTERVLSVALDSPHDYDPVWRRCVELKIPVACHSGARGGGSRHSSPSNFVFNHLGGFATASNFFCRSVFMDGITRRFPELNFAFLECGVGWAAQLYNDLIEHWEKRNVAHMQANLDPAKVDLALMEEMAEKYGEGIITRDAVRHHQRSDFMGGQVNDVEELDDFRRCEIAKPEDIVDLFVKPFYFGCEADDRMNAVAFDTRLNHFGQRLKAFLSSDIGHWDVVDMNDVLPEAYENVENGLFTEDDFRDFVFVNAASYYTRQNPEFFAGTVIADDVARLAQTPAAAD